MIPSPRELLACLERRTLRVKLLAGFGLVLTVPLALGLVSLLSIERLNRDSQRIYREYVQGLIHLTEANQRRAAVGRELRQIVLDPRPQLRRRRLSTLNQDKRLLSNQLQEALAHKQPARPDRRPAPGRGPGQPLPATGEPDPGSGGAPAQHPQPGGRGGSGQ